MRCGRCGYEAPVLKTCRPRDGHRYGRRFTLCDDCWRPVAAWVWIMPGPVYAWGVCRSCSGWASMNELQDVASGGRHDAPTGVCSVCALRVLAGALRVGLAPQGARTCENGGRR